MKINFSIFGLFLIIILSLMGFFGVKATEPEYFEFDSQTKTLTNYNTLGGQNVVIPSEIDGVKVEKIEGFAFSESTLETVEIPNSVTKIGSYVFYDNNLKTVEIPNSVTEIGSNAFYDNNLKTVKIPNSVTKIGGYAFSENNLKTVDISNSVTIIGSYAFSDNNLETIEIPDGVTEISGGAFSHNKLKTVKIPYSVKEIGDYAFSDNNLETVEIPYFWVNISHSAFDDDVKLIIGTKLPSEIAACVYGEEITINELKQYVNKISGKDTISKRYEIKLLKDLIINKLLIQKAQDRDIVVSDEEMNNIFKQQIKALKQKYKLNDEQLEQAINQQGFESMQQYKNIFLENNMNEFLVNKLREEVVNEVSISDEEVKEFYDNNPQQFEISEQKRISHILFDEKEKAEEVLAEINKGSDFAEMAREHSTGPTAEKGGDLGFITANEQGLVRNFLDAAMQLSVGDISSEPVETQFGFHLIKVTDFREAFVREFEEVKSQIKAQMRNQKQRQIFQEFRENLFENSKHEINYRFSKIREEY